MTVVAAIDTDNRRMTRALEACQRLVIIPGVGQLAALAFVAAIDGRRASTDRETSEPLLAWSRDAINRARSTTSAPSAATVVRTLLYMSC
jgi:hypothetical protein